MNFRNHLSGALLAAAVTFFCACTPRNEITYFQDIDNIPTEDWSKTYPTEPRLQFDDDLVIIVNATDNDAVSVFNKPGYITQSVNATTLNTQTTLQHYLVDKNGDIEFPVLGQLHVVGMTATELRDMLRQRISAYVADPMVTVNLTSFSVSVMGEVMSPGLSFFSGNRATILEAITRRGDLTVYGDRTNVLLIREDNEGKREFHHIDLTSADILNSPYYYMKQNDVIYVSPNEARRSSSHYNSMKQQNLSLISTIVSVVSVLSTLAIAIWK